MKITNNKNPFGVVIDRFAFIDIPGFAVLEPIDDVGRKTISRSERDALEQAIREWRRTK